MKARVHIEEQFSLSKDKLWEIMLDIKNYPQFVPFVKKAGSTGVLGMGSQWYDLTTILWIPLIMQHIITLWKPKEAVSYTIPLPFQGIMEHSFLLKESKGQVRLFVDINYFLGNKTVHNLLTPLLNKRLEYMFITALQRIKDAKV